ncbi:MAG: hypothetical protein CMI90_05790, partial [Pelagibacteraceae bacterium]|nr:hypothetical protein [Pelagibacteraceae bacterium]
MIIRLIFILIFLSSCDKYLGTIDKDYTPTKKLITIENNNLFNSNKEIIFPNIAKPTNFNLFNLPVGNLSSNNLNKIQKISKYDNKSNIVFFNNDIIFISNN